MIDDWVQFEIGQISTNPHQIDSIDLVNMEICADGEIYDIKDTKMNPKSTFVVKPIPLTSGVLKKNFGKLYVRGGFNCYTHSSLSVLGTEYKIGYMIEDRSYLAAPDNRICLCRENGTWICELKYVHELQHALKLLYIYPRRLNYERKEQSQSSQSSE